MEQTGAEAQEREADEENTWYIPWAQVEERKVRSRIIA
jgi:hypothetical protein